MSKRWEAGYFSTGFDLSKFRSLFLLESSRSSCVDAFAAFEFFLESDLLNVENDCDLDDDDESVRCNEVSASATSNSWLDVDRGVVDSPTDELVFLRGCGSEFCSASNLWFCMFLAQRGSLCAL